MPLPAVGLQGMLLYCVLALSIAVFALLVHTAFMLDPRAGNLEAMRIEPALVEAASRRRLMGELAERQAELERLHALHAAINERLFAGPGSAPGWYLSLIGPSEEGRRPEFERSFSPSSDSSLPVRVRTLAAELDAYIGTNAAHIQVYGSYLRGVPHRWPLANGRRKINSGFGMRSNPFYGSGGSGPRKLHRGVDLKARPGDRVVAAAEGLVLEARRSNYGYGNLVRVFHPSGYVTLYAHLSAIHVKREQYVKPGDVVGAAGSSGHSTGPHLHYEVHRQGKAIDPVEFIVED